MKLHSLSTTLAGGHSNATFGTVHYDHAVGVIRRQSGLGLRRQLIRATLRLHHLLSTTVAGSSLQLYCQQLISRAGVIRHRPSSDLAAQHRSHQELLHLQRACSKPVRQRMLAATASVLRQLVTDRLQIVKPQQRRVRCRRPTVNHLPNSTH